MGTLSRSDKVRPPAVAGTFYPARPERLRAEVERLLAAVPDFLGPTPKAVIAPHAGYVYSGAVAAQAFATLRNARPAARVVVIGPAHYVPVAGIAIPKVEAFETPLGRVPVDREALDRLSRFPFVSVADPPHAPEHALEVELPFLQAVLGPFALVPLLVGSASPEHVAQALDPLWNDSLIVVSSDLSHYHDYPSARRRDAATANAIERQDANALSPDDACGYLPIAGLLRQTGARGLQVQRLAMCNSGDTAGPRDRVVGYGAWAWTAGQRGAAAAPP